MNLLHVQMNVDLDMVDDVIHSLSFIPSSLDRGYLVFNVVDVALRNGGVALNRLTWDEETVTADEDMASLPVEKRGWYQWVVSKFFSLVPSNYPGNFYADVMLMVDLCMWLKDDILKDVTTNGLLSPDITSVVDVRGALIILQITPIAMTRMKNIYGL